MTRDTLSDSDQDSWWPFYYVLSGKYLMLKEYTCKLKYMRRSTSVHKYALHFKNARLWLVLYKQSLVHKITIVRRVQSNSFIDFISSNNDLINYSSPYRRTTVLLFLLASATSELDKINILAHVKSIKCHTRFKRENYFLKVDFDVFYGTILNL